ncbi:MAG: HAD family phosphatase, partial [Okeania sp. SIO3C4]|nr:HAD family phosphatase [Okeania sp. SIO3C4]
MAIKNIIFDLGGVVLNIDPKLTIAAFEAFGLKDVAAKYNFPNQVHLFDQLEVGEISPAEFRDGLRELFETPLTDAQIDEAWNTMLLDFPEGRLEALERVGENYPTFLLSNT